MNAEHPTTNQTRINESGEIQLSPEQEGIWQQIQQHFQTTQSSLSVRLVCEGNVVNQVGDIKTGVREASRLFALQHSPIKAEELIASQESLFSRKCQQWEQVAKAAEARERAKATGGRTGSSSAANRRKLETAHNGIRNQISNAKQCLRRLRTALNRGIATEVQINSLKKNQDGTEEEQSSVALDGQQIQPTDSGAIETTGAGKHQPTVSAKQPSLAQRQSSRVVACLQSIIGDGIPLDYRTAPFNDPFSDEGLKSREAIWTGSQPFCLIVQWEDSQNSTLNLKFWIVPKRPELVPELRSDQLPNLFLHTKVNREAEKLDFELATHNSQNGPLTSEMTQLLNRIESERFLSAELDQKSPLCYLTCTAETDADFDSAVQLSYLLEIL